MKYSRRRPLARSYTGNTYVSAHDFHNLVLAITVERCPFDGVWVFSAPVPRQLLASMCHSKTAALVRMRQAHDQRSELGRAARGVDMSVELATGAGIDLYSHQLGL